ncbi:F-box protein-like [Forsythia ovata]|uniref:F-box protein-like n=1 Tax=Forsythia ovata TaxID=205694 RepID=A0ABD1PHP0_9LAMI
MEAQKQFSNVDRISELPDSLCHHILSFLSAIDAGGTVFLSRRWRSLWYSVPVYFFDGFFNSWSQPKFSMFFKETLICRQRYFNYLSIHKFRLRMKMSRGFDPSALHWILFALKTNVKKLFINNYGNNCPTIPSILSDAIFTARSITKLDIVCLSIEEISVSLSLPSLQKLSLSSTSISDSTLQKLLSACSVVRKVSLYSLCGLEKIKISSETLEELTISQCPDIEFFLDYAPNVKFFAFEAMRIGGNKIGISVFRKLTTLTLIDARVTDSMVANLLFQNPLLEKLVLVNCDIIEKLLIASPNLGSFSLRSCASLVEVKIDAPNLQELEYRGEFITFSSVISSPLLEATIYLEDYSRSSLTIWYAKLKDLFEKLQYSKTLSVACFEELDLIIPGKMRKSLLPQLHALKHLKVEINKPLGDNGGKLEKGLRWMFPCLRTLDIRCYQQNFEEHYEYKEDNHQLLGGNAGISLVSIQFREIIRWLFIKFRWLFIKLM